MPRYEVYIVEQNRGVITVDAEDEDEAIDEANEMLHEVDWFESEIQDMFVEEIR